MYSWLSYFPSLNNSIIYFSIVPKKDLKFHTLFHHLATIRGSLLSPSVSIVTYSDLKWITSLLSPPIEPKKDIKFHTLFYHLGCHKRWLLVFIVTYGNLTQITSLLLPPMAFHGHWPIHSFLSHSTLESIYECISAPIVCEDTNSVDKNRDIENWLQGTINWTGSAKVCHQNSSPWPNWLKLDPQSHLPPQARPCHLKRASRRPQKLLLNCLKKSSSHFSPAL